MSLADGKLLTIYPRNHIATCVLIYLLLDKFPSSVAFDAINQALQSDEPTRTDAVKKTKAIFGFQLKNKAGETEGWYVDLKDKGEVGKGSTLGAGRKTDG